MQFTKMHGAGNDFIIINNIEEKISADKFPELAARLCRRKMSVGADGLMVVESPEGDADFRMRFYNSDGSIGEMCGNGARCIARYGFESGLAGAVQRIETTAGTVCVRRENRRIYTVRLNDVSRLELNKRVEIDGRIYMCAYVELGNPGIPHAVLRIDGLASYDRDELLELGRALRFHKAFPRGANVNFYDIAADGMIRELTYERGVEDFTLACGTGTGAVVTVLTVLGITDGKNVKVTMPGGELSVTLTCKNGQPENLYLTGPTHMVAEGRVLDMEDAF